MEIPQSSSDDSSGWSSHALPDGSHFRSCLQGSETQYVSDLPRNVQYTWYRRQKRSQTLFWQLHSFRKFLRCICHTHAFSAAAKSCLDDHRITDPLGFLKTGFNILHIPFAARNYRNTSCIIVLLAIFLLPSMRMTFDGGPTNVIPHFSQSSANLAFSERKPNPG